jgi:hypothetical protein
MVSSERSDRCKMARQGIHRREKKAAPGHTIHYALRGLEKVIIRVVRTLTWCPLDELTEIHHACCGGMWSKGELVDIGQRTSRLEVLINYPLRAFFFRQK